VLLKKVALNIFWFCPDFNGRLTIRIIFLIEIITIHYCLIKINSISKE